MASLLAGFIFDVVYGSRTLSLLLCTLGLGKDLHAANLIRTCRKVPTDKSLMTSKYTALVIPHVKKQII